MSSPNLEHRNLDVDMAEELAPRYIRDRPNSYTFTKSVAEYMVASEATDIPMIIVRPSIVGPTWKEPVAGWSDNFNGMMWNQSYIALRIQKIHHFFQLSLNNFKHRSRRMRVCCGHRNVSRDGRRSGLGNVYCLKTLCSPLTKHCIARM